MDVYNFNMKTIDIHSFHGKKKGGAKVPLSHHNTLREIRK